VKGVQFIKIAPPQAVESVNALLEIAEGLKNHVHTAETDSLGEDI
jgi:hypothetical protein